MLMLCLERQKERKTNKNDLNLFWIYRAHISDISIFFLKSFYFSDPEWDSIQPGFRVACITETVLEAVTERLYALRSAKLSSALIYLDLSAGTDNCKALLLILMSSGLNGPLRRWFTRDILGIHSCVVCVLLCSISEVNSHCILQ